MPPSQLPSPFNSPPSPSVSVTLCPSLPVFLCSVSWKIGFKRPLLWTRASHTVGPVRFIFHAMRGGGGVSGERGRETRRMEKNSFDQSLKPITRRKLLTRGLSSAVCLSLLSLHLSNMTPPSLPLLSLHSRPFLLSFVQTSPCLSLPCMSFYSRVPSACAQKISGHSGHAMISMTWN